jgi:hypothetical protein
MIRQFHLQRVGGAPVGNSKEEHQRSRFRFSCFLITQEHDRNRKDPPWRQKSQAETKAAPEPPLFESIQDTAHALGVSGNTVRNLIAEGRLQTVSIKRRKLVVRSSRDDYAASLLQQGK